MVFGEYVEKLRKARGLTLTEAARHLGISPQKLSDIEKGRRNFKREPPAGLLRKMSEAYHHPLASLIDHTELFHYEKSLVYDLLSDVDPHLKTLAKEIDEIAREAEKYTPEMEGAARRAQECLGRLKTGVEVARKRVSRGARVSIVVGKEHEEKQ